MHSFLHHGLPLLPRLEAWLEGWVSTGGTAVVFLVSLIEGIPPIGLLAPSHTVILFAGFLAKIGAISLPAVFLAAVAGAVAGNVIGYWMGRSYGYAFLVRAGRIFSLKKSAVERLKGLVATHPGKAIVLGKVNPLTRALTPFVAGASRVSPARFFSIAVASDIAWTVVDLSIGYVFGEGYHAAASVLGRAVVIALVTVIALAASYRFVNRQFHIFARYELLSLLANLAGLVGFAISIQGIVDRHAFMIAADVATNIWFGALVQAAPWLVDTALSVSAVLGPIVLATAGLLLAAWFIHRRSWRYLVVTLSSLAGGYGLTYFLKGLIASPRPPDALYAAFGYSFPSGHAVAAGIALVLVSYFFLPAAASRARRIALLAGSLALALLVGASRLVLGVHWLSDVIAGYSLGIFWTTAMILLVRYGGLLWSGFAGMWRAEEAVQ